MFRGGATNELFDTTNRSKSQNSCQPLVHARAPIGAGETRQTRARTTGRPCEIRLTCYRSWSGSASHVACTIRPSATSVLGQTGRRKGLHVPGNISCLFIPIFVFHIYLPQSSSVEDGAALRWEATSSSYTWRGNPATHVRVKRKDSLPRGGVVECERLKFLSSLSPPKQQKTAVGSEREMDTFVFILFLIPFGKSHDRAVWH